MTLLSRIKQEYENRDAVYRADCLLRGQWHSIWSKYRELRDELAKVEQRLLRTYEQNKQGRNIDFHWPDERKPNYEPIVCPTCGHQTWELPNAEAE